MLKMFFFFGKSKYPLGFNFSQSFIILVNLSQHIYKTAEGYIESRNSILMCFLPPNTPPVDQGDLILITGAAREIKMPDRQKTKHN